MLKIALNRTACLMNMRWDEKGNPNKNIKKFGSKYPGDGWSELSCLLELTN